MASTEVSWRYSIGKWTRKPKRDERDPRSLLGRVVSLFWGNKAEEKQETVICSCKNGCMRSFGFNSRKGEKCAREREVDDYWWGGGGNERRKQR